MVATSCNWHSTRWPKWKCYVLSFHVPASASTASRISQASPENTPHAPLTAQEPRTETASGMGMGMGKATANCELKRKLAEMKLIYSVRLLNFSVFSLCSFFLKVNHIRGAAQQAGLSTRFSRRGKGCATLGRIRENRLPRNIELLSALICAALRNAYSTRHI